MPNNDYWDIFSSILRMFQNGANGGDLLYTSNEHIVVGTKIIYLMNYYATAGNNFGLSIITIFFSSVILAISLRILISAKESSIVILLISIIASMLAFNPLSAHNFFLGMSGVAWVGANLFMVAAVYAFFCAEQTSNKVAYLFAFLFAAISMQFYSTGLATLCAIGALGLFSPRGRIKGLLIFLAGLAVIAAVAAVQVPPDGHGSRSFDITRIVHFVPIFLGGGITTSMLAAELLGWVGIFLTVLIMVVQVKKLERARFDTAFWISIVVYAGIVSGLAAVGRSNMGSELASRYATIPSLFWLGVFGAGLSLIARHKLFRLSWIALFLFAIVNAFVDGFPRVESALMRADEKPLATLAFVLGVQDNKVLSAITPVPEQFFASQASLEEIGHVPFDGTFAACPHLGSVIHLNARTNDVIGFIDQLSPTGDADWLQVSGWLAKWTMRPLRRAISGR